MVAPDLPWVCRGPMTRPALVALAVERLLGLCRAYRLAVPTRERREEVHHVEFGVGITRLDTDRGRGGRVVVSTRYREIVDENPLGAIHDRFPRQAVLIEELAVGGQQVEFAAEGHR